MFACIEDEEYEDAQNDSSEAERIEFISLFVYFEEVKRGLHKDKIFVDAIEKHIRSRDIINIFSDSKDLFEFHNRLMEQISDYAKLYSIEADLRILLYNIIEEAYGGYLLHILRRIHLRIAELKTQEEFYDRIVRLSYIYCINNGIDFP